MELTEKEKKKIEEEERYRAEVKKGLAQGKTKEKKKGIGCLPASLIIIAVVFILTTAVLAAINPAERQKQLQTSPQNNTNTQDSQELIGYVNFDGTQFIISNVDKYTCQNARMQVNGDYTLEGYDLESALESTTKSGEAAVYKVGAGQFTKKDGTRFNPFSVKPQNFSISCRGDNELSSAFGYWEFK